MENCEYCEIEENGQMIYEEQDVIAFLPHKAMTKGHIIVAPKQHVTIIEETEQDIVGKILEISNKMSTILFDSMQIAGTNLIIPNGLPAGQETPHLSMHIIPRKENDGLELSWAPTQIPPELLEATKKELTQPVSLDKKPLPQAAPREETPKDGEIKGKDNYLIKHFRKKI